MATIGVTRGLGDHDLKVYNSNIHIKPFLSCCPEVGHETLFASSFPLSFIPPSTTQLKMRMNALRI